MWYRRGMADTLTLQNKARASQLHDEIYQRNCCGCCWHITFDDDNLDQGSVEFCIRQAALSQHPDCIEVGSLVLAMSLSQRKKLVRGGYRRLNHVLAEQEMRKMPIDDLLSIDKLNELLARMN